MHRAVEAEKEFDAAHGGCSAEEEYDTEKEHEEADFRTDDAVTSEHAEKREGNSFWHFLRGREGGLGGSRLPVVFLLLAVCVLLVLGGRSILRSVEMAGGSGTGGNKLAGAGMQTPGSAKKSLAELSPLQRKLGQAERLAAQYDYDGALQLLREDSALSSEPKVQEAVASYEEAKAALVPQDISTVTHVFFHSLVVDAENAFDKEKWGKQADGYNQVMTTIPEFRKMLEQFYADGFVLVRLHDLASMQKQPDGSMKMTPGKILLPEGKKAMVMSQDDVCYYEYMTGAGFADRMIVGEDGRPTSHYTDKNGQEFVGEYDLVPILDRFVEEHPDFSYRGAKACLAFTGYNGILGYRTDETYDPDSPLFDSSKTPNENIEADRETARQVVKALREDGYELASHSWGHRDLGNISFERMKKDTDRWDKNVNQELLGGDCDIILYPFGADVGDWHPYSHDNERFQYLFDKGFRYFCNVDSTQHWVQRGDDWLRQGRRNLDGDAMWQDIANGKNRLSDLFPDVSAIFDKARPTPVPHG